MQQPLTLTPSTAHRWTACVGSPKAIRNVERRNEDREAAKEGECAAWVADAVLRGDATTTEDMLGKVHRNGVEVTEEMIDLVQDYVDLIQSIAGNTEVFSEYEIEIGAIRGRLDSGIVKPLSGTLHIFDLKYGRRPIEAFENVTMLIYAFGLLVNQHIPPDTIHTVALHIFQPRGIHRLGPHRTWSLTTNELNHWSQWIMDRAEQCVSGEPLLTPGPHCAHCPVAASCSALTGTVYDHVEIITDNDWRPARSDELGRELFFLRSAQDLLKSRVAAVEAEIEARIANSEFVPGWGMSTRYGNRAWSVSAATIQMITGIDPHEPKLMTPAKVERQLGSKKDLVKNLTRKPVTGQKLEPVTDRTFSEMFSKRKG